MDLRQRVIRPKKIHFHKSRVSESVRRGRVSIIIKLGISSHPQIFEREGV